jgi:hypothetical protein
VDTIKIQRNDIEDVFVESQIRSHPHISNDVLVMKDPSVDISSMDNIAVRYSLPEEMLDTIKSSILADHEFIDKIRCGEAAVPFRETKIGKEFTNDIFNFELRISRMEKKLDSTLERLSVFLQDFELPD